MTIFMSKEIYSVNSPLLNLIKNQAGSHFAAYLTLGKQLLKHSHSKISVHDICKAIGGIACL